jgi:hypothetical protein
MQTNGPHKTDRFRHNPLAARLAKRAGCLGGRIPTALAFVSGLALSACVIREMLLNPHGPFIVSGWSMVLAIAMSVSLLVFMAYVAATVTSRYMYSLEYPLLCTTTLSDGEIVKAYIAAAMRYGRAVMALLLGLVPQIACQLLESEYSVVPYRGPLAMTAPSLLVFVAKRVLIAVLLGVGLRNIYLLTAALGTWFGTWWRSMLPAALAALTVTSGVVVATGYCLSEVIPRTNVTGVFPQSAISLGLFMLFPYVLSFGCMRLARHWARKR